MYADKFVMNKLLLILSSRSSCDAVSADMQTEAVLELMKKLSSFCRDSDFASDFATVGGHTILRELLNSDSSSECVQESADDIVCSILMSGNTFPSRSILPTPRPTAIAPITPHFVNITVLNSMASGISQ